MYLSRPERQDWASFLMNNCMTVQILRSVELLIGTGTLVTQAMEKAELLNALDWQSQAMETRRNSEARKSYPWWKRIKLEITQANWTYVSLWLVMEQTRKCWRSWLMRVRLLLILFEWSLVARKRCLEAGRKQMCLLYSEKTGRITQKTTGQSALPWSLKRWWNK